MTTWTTRTREITRRRDGVRWTIAVDTDSDTTVVGGSTYSYTVDAVDAAGNRSAQSAPASVTVR